MPDGKNSNWAADYSSDAESNPSTPDAALTPSETAANESDGWKQYHERK